MRHFHSSLVLALSLGLSAELAAQDLPCQDCEAPTVACGESFEGRLVEGECVLPTGELVAFRRFRHIEAQNFTATLVALEPSEGLEGELELALLSSDCAPVATVRSTVAEAAADGLVLAVAVDAAVYYLALRAPGPLEFRFESGCDPRLLPCRDCEVAEIRCGETQNIFLGDGCRSLDEGRPLDVVRFTKESAGPVTIRVEAEFDATLALLDEDCRELAYNDDCVKGEGDSCLVDIDLPAGEFFALVAPFEIDGEGAYDIALACPDVSACIECQQGILETGDRLAAAMGAVEGSCEEGEGVFLDLYRLGVPARSTLVLELERTDAVEDGIQLVARDVACRELAVESSVAADGRVRGLLRGVEEGSLWIGARGSAGSYLLGVEAREFAPCLDCAEGELRCGDRSLGELAPGDCRLDGGDLFDAWRLELEEGRQVSIALRSGVFDSFLVLRDAECRYLGENDNEATGRADSEIVRWLDAGTYWVIASGLGGDRGAYELEVSCAENRFCEDCPVREIGCGETATGLLGGAGSCRDETREAALDLWSFELRGRTSLELELESTRFDPVLRLFAESCSLLAENDDCRRGDFERSCLRVALEPGRYFLTVESFDGRGGDYRLLVGGECDGLQLPGDCNQDAELGLADAICVLGYLFRGQPARLPCAGGRSDENLDLVDHNGDGRLDLADAIGLLVHLFLGGPPHVLGTGCRALGDCPDRC